MSSRALLLVVGLAVLIAVTGVAAQRDCDLTSSSQAVSITTNDARVNYVSLPRITCTDGTSIEADSAVVFEATSFSQLFGNVVFLEGQRALYADRAQYFSRAARLQAQGSVRLLNSEDGSLVTGEDLILLQQNEDRAEDDMTMRGGRPHATLIPRVTSDSTAVEGSPVTARPDSVGEPAPYEIDAELIRFVGDRLVQARGRVEVRNKSMQSYGDSLEFLQDIGSLTLFRNARLLSPDSASGDTLDVRGDTITLSLPDNQIDQIEARGRSRLLAGDVDMRGPVIRLLFEGEELERVFAVRRSDEEIPIPVTPEDTVAALANPAQPQAVAEDFLLTGDSIEAEVSGGALERVVATGTARGVSTARDSLNTEAMEEILRYDWMEGHTIIATFGPEEQEPADSGSGASEPTAEPSRDHVEAAEPEPGQLHLLVARGEARSFYRSPPDSVATEAGEGPQCLDLNYVIGDEIRLFMKEGEIERMEVDNPTGVYMQPNCPSAPAGELQADPGAEPSAVPPGPDGGPPPARPGASDQPPTVSLEPTGKNGGAR